jgi:hypothetical protein
MADDTSSQRFFAQIGRATFADLPPARHMRPKLKFGVSADLPDSLKTRHTLVRNDFPRSPDNTTTKPSFAFNELAFYSNKAASDSNSPKLGSTFDMHNVYRVDLQLKLPYFKEYRRVLATEGFAKAKGMCASLAELKAVNSIGRSPDKFSLKTLKKHKSVPRPPPTKEPTTHPKAGPLLQALIAHKPPKRLTMKTHIRSASIEVAESRASIDDFEERLKHNLMAEVQTQHFFYD